MTEKDNYRADYVLYLHRNKGNDEIFYVGIGTEMRAKNLVQRNFLWKNYVKIHGKPKIEIYRKNLNMLEAINLEFNFIKALGRRIEKTGNLTNLDCGGTGVALTRRDPEILKKGKLAASWYKHPTGKDHWAYGTKLSEERKLEISAQWKGTKQSDSHIEKRVAPRRGKRMRQESIDKMAASLRGKTLPQEVKDKIAVTSKERWKDEKYRENMISQSLGKVRNGRKVINNITGVIYENGKQAASALNIKHGYFTAMIGGFFDNKTNCSYLEPRPFSNGKTRKFNDSIAIKN